MVELFIYVALSVVSFSLARVYGGIKNAAFYAKGSSHQNHKLIKKFIDNLHYAETPSWYTHAASNFFAYMALMRLGFGQSILISVALAVLVVMSGSAIASLFYQGYINVANGLPFVNPDENKKSEFAFWFIRFWWTRPFSGRGRR